jgi:hypothetical protein
MKSMIKSSPTQVIDEIKHRIQRIDYLEAEERKDIIDYISAKVKSEIWPFLRLARTVRRGYYPKWVSFQRLLAEFEVEEELTRANNYGPLPERLEQHWNSAGVLELEQYIDFFRALHAEEDQYHNELFEEAFEDWARPALRYAFERVDVKKSDKEIVRYVCLVFYTEFIKLRAESQGLRRKRRNGKWIYYYEKGINEFDFLHEDVYQLIFHIEDEGEVLTLGEIAKKLTKKQVSLLISVYNYVRDDVRNLSTDDFYKKYPNTRMNYRRAAIDMGYSYEAFVKNIQRMRLRIVQ